MKTFAEFAQLNENAGLKSCIRVSKVQKVPVMSSLEELTRFLNKQVKAWNSSNAVEHYGDADIKGFDVVDGGLKFKGKPSERSMRDFVSAVYKPIRSLGVWMDQAKTHQIHAFKLLPDRLLRITFV